MAKKLLNLDTTSGALSFEDSESLPSGTVNQTLRHDGTNWVANSTLQNYGNGTVRIEGASQGLMTIKGGTTRTEYGANSSSGFINQHDGGGYLLSSISMGTDISINQSRSTTAKFSLLFPMVSDVNRKIFEIDSGFSVYKDYRIKTDYLSGSGTALLEATSDGTMQRSATALTQTKIINRVLTSASSIHSFDNTDLGISGDLTTKIFSFELMRKINGNDYFSLGELVQTEKTLTSSAVTFATGEIPSGDTIRLAITYTD